MYIYNFFLSNGLGQKQPIIHSYILIIYTLFYSSNNTPLFIYFRTGPWWAMPPCLPAFGQGNEQKSVLTENKKLMLMLFGYGLLLGPMFCSCSYLIFTLSHVLVISWKWCTGSRFSIMKMECSRLTPNQGLWLWRIPVSHNMGKKASQHEGYTSSLIREFQKLMPHRQTPLLSLKLQCPPFLNHQAVLCPGHMYLTRKIASGLSLSSQEAKLKKNSSSYGTKSSHVIFRSVYRLRRRWTSIGKRMAPPPVWLQDLVPSLVDTGQLHMGKKGCWRISFPPVPQLGNAFWMVSTCDLTK